MQIIKGRGQPCALLLLSDLGLWDAWAAWHLVDSQSDVLCLEVECVCLVQKM